jgi:hypothetical protein
MSDPDHRRLDDLRQRLAWSENPQTIHEIGRAAARLAERAVIESIVRDCAVLVARCKAKARQCRARASARRAASAPKHTPLGGLSPQIAMIVTPWTKDELGNLSREIYADESVPVRL